MKPFGERLERIEVEEQVHIPTLDGSGIANTIQVKVPALRDPKDGEIYFDSEATALLDKVKARHMGLLAPEQIRCLRDRLGLTQREISELLQIGEKTWTRWETGRERPSRVINVMLCALSEGKMDVAYLRSLARRRNDWAPRLTSGDAAARNPWHQTVQQLWQNWAPDEPTQIAEALRRAIVESITRGAQSDFFPKLPTHVEIVVHYPILNPSKFIRVQPAEMTGAVSRPVTPAAAPVSTGPFPEDAIAA